MALVSAIAALLSPFPVDTDAKADDLPVTISFTWSVDRRFTDLDGDGHPDDVTERFDRDFDGRVDPGLRDQAWETLLPDEYPVHMDACASHPADQVQSWEWSVEIDGAWEALPDDECSLTYGFPDEGTYAIEITAVTGDGSYVAQRSVEVDDLVIVGMGDSFGAGEGAPHVEGLFEDPNDQWTNPRCHRSAYADQAVAANWLELRDPHTSVTFVHLACSGAQIGDPAAPDPAKGGVLTPYNGIAPPSENSPALPAQVDQLRDYLDRDGDDRVDREVDAVVMSGGGNDGNFADIALSCLAFPLCQLNPGTLGLVLNGQNALEHRLSLLPKAFEDLGVDLDALHQREYPDPVWLAPYVPCPSILTGPALGLALLGIGMGPDESIFASQVVLAGMNNRIRDAAAGRWHYIDGITERYFDDGGTSHGECALGNRWFNTVFDSFGKQGNKDGSLHPNRAGYEANAKAIFDDLAGVLTEQLPPCLPFASAAVTGDATTGWDIVNTSTSTCDDDSLTASWSLNGGGVYGSALRVTSGDLRCGTGGTGTPVRLTVTSTTGDRATATVNLPNATTATQPSEELGPDLHLWPDDNFRTPSHAWASGTGCDGVGLHSQTATSGSVGWADCLADPRAFVQPGPSSAPCASDASPSYARSQRSPDSAVHDAVAATNLRSASAPEDMLGNGSNAGSEAYYRVVAPAGTTTVQGEVRVDQSLSLTMGSPSVTCPPNAICGGAPVNTSGYVSSAGAVDRLYPTVQCNNEYTPPRCWTGIGQESAAHWNTDVSANECVVECRTCTWEWWGCNPTLTKPTREMLRSQLVWGNVTEATVLVDNEALDYEPRSESHVNRIPFTAQAGDVIRVNQGLVAGGGYQPDGNVAGHIGEHVEVIMLTGGVTLVPIVTDATGPTLTLQGTNVADGDVGTETYEVQATLSEPLDHRVKVTPKATPGTATTADYVAPKGTITFEPGETTKTVAFGIKGDALEEGDEAFTIGAKISGDPDLLVVPGTVNILDDDGPPTLAIGDATLVEGNTGSVNGRLIVTLSAPAKYDIPLHWATTGGTATSGSDFRAKSSDVVIRRGKTTAVVNVPINGDTLLESSETVDVTISSDNDHGVVVTDAVGTITIDDDDPSSSGARLSDSALYEGDAGKRTVFVALRTPTALSTDTTITYQVLAGTADGSDAQVQTRTAKVGRNKTFVLLPVTVFGDLAVEGDETIVVRGLSAPGLTFTDPEAIITVRNDD